MAKRALVVDDTPYIRADIREILERNGFEVTEAENGAEAVELYKEGRPDLVTMDINMPRLNGMKATKIIVDYDSNAKIMMCSSMIMFANYKEMCREAGAKAFLSKPYTKIEFLEEMTRLFL